MITLLRSALQYPPTQQFTLVHSTKSSSNIEWWYRIIPKHTDEALWLNCRRSWRMNTVETVECIMKTLCLYLRKCKIIDIYRLKIESTAVQAPWSGCCLHITIITFQKMRVYITNNVTKEQLPPTALHCSNQFYVTVNRSLRKHLNRTTSYLLSDLNYCWIHVDCGDCAHLPSYHRGNSKVI